MRPISVLSTVILLSVLSLSWLPGYQSKVLSASAVNATDSLQEADSSEVTDDNTTTSFTSVYSLLDLKAKGLSKEAFQYACKGYQKLIDKGVIDEAGLLTICDFSRSSGQKRFFLIDMAHAKLLINTFVAHGKNSGEEFATHFSNTPESLQSSLGFYITRNTYMGEHGLSLKLEGLEKGFNDRAMSRNIVVHGADYIDPAWLRSSARMGRSFGCPAVPANESRRVINYIKNGTCLFIYHPSRNYLNGSKILNG